MNFYLEREYGGKALFKLNLFEKKKKVQIVFVSEYSKVGKEALTGC